MAINFPPDPDIGEFYQEDGSPFIYQWNGTGWIIPPSLTSIGEGEANQGANLGIGVEVYEGKVAEFLRFRTLVSTDESVTIEQLEQEINLKAGAAGEVNDGQNIGAGLGEVYSGKPSTSLQFRRIQAADGSMEVETLGDSVRLRATDQGGQANAAANVGAGPGKVWRDRTGPEGTLNFKSIRAGDGTIVVENEADTIAIRATGGGGGENNTGQNLGLGAQVFEEKVGLALRFRTLVSGDESVTFAQGAETIDIRSTGTGGGEINAGENIGLGDAEVYAGKPGFDLQFRRLASDATINITQTADSIQFSAVDQGGEANDGQNVGGGQGEIYRDKDAGSGLINLKTLVASTGVSINNLASTIELSADGVLPDQTVNWTGRHNMAVNPVASTATTTFDWSNGNKIRCSLSTSITSVNLINPGAQDATFSITFKQAAGSTHTVTGWPGSVKWIGGAAPDFTQLGNNEYMRVDFEWDATDAVYVGSFGMTS